MHPNPHLDALIAHENCQEILAELRPHELAIVVLRLDDLRYDEAAERLGLTRERVYQRMRAARQRLAANCPHILRARVRQP